MFMRLMVMFDLPVNKKKLRKEYSKFRRFLLNDGYDMMQYSIYSRICNGLDSVDKHMSRLQEHVPKKGCIRAMIVTERQFESIAILVGTVSPQEKRVKTQQLSIF